MPRRLLLDGDDLGALMQRVRSEMGPDAVVVKAERVRTGGVAGFFAKERFEVTVEVPDPRPGSRPRPTAAPGPVGLSALLDAADAADDGAPGVRPGRGARPADAPQVPRVSTDGDTFANLLASIDGMADVHPAGAQPPAGPTPTGGPGAEAPPSPPKPPAARFAPQGATVTAVAFAPLDPAPTTTGPTAPDAGSTPDDPAATPGGAGGNRPAPEEAPAAAPASGSAAAPTPGVGRVVEPAAPRLPAPPALPAPPPLPAAPAVPVGPGAGAPGSPGPTFAPAPGGSSRRDLGRLGVPASLLGPGPPDEPLPISSLLGALPRPPGLLRAPGALVVVVGEGPSALPVATALAQRARLEPREVVLAGDMPPVQGHGRRLLHPAAAARHRARASDAETVGFVAVGVGPEAEDRTAAAALLAELAPDQTWAVVDARRKTADLRAWLHDVTGPRPVDVVAASWVHGTQEPGTVLDLGAPVGWVDGLPATPVVWAAVLSERLDAGARWD